MTKKIHICKSCRKIIASTVPVCSRCSLTQLQALVKNTDSLTDALFEMRKEEAKHEE